MIEHEKECRAISQICFTICKNHFILWCILFFFTQSCRKSHIEIADSRSYSEKFFEIPESSSPELQGIINVLKTENEKTGFIDTLSYTGLPVWGRLIIEKTKPKTATDQKVNTTHEEGCILIPLSSNNKTLSALLFAMKKDGKYEFHCYDNNYAYGIVHNTNYTVKERERVMALFMNMTSYVFGIRNFKSIPVDLFAGLKGGIIEEGGKTKKMFLVPSSSPPDIFATDVIAGTTTICVYAWSGKCHCPGSTKRR